IMNNKKEYTAELIGTDPSTDLALIKVDAKALPFIAFGNSDSTRVGEWVLAVGNPFNLESTVTAGIVSAKGRNINILRDQGSIEAFIQTDAAVNPGNSGGALVNLHGELIGINSAIATPTGTFAGYSFAVPVNIVRKVVNDLAKFGMVQRGILGVSIANITADLATEKSLAVYDGVFVDSIYPGSAAAEAGVRKGDVITAINGSRVNSVSELQEHVSRYHPGDNVTVTVLRDEKEKTFTAKLKNIENTTEYLKKNAAAAALELQTLGAQFKDLTDKEKRDTGLKGGVKVSELSNEGLLSRMTDIREGFIITGVDGKPVNSVRDLKAMLENRKGSVLIEGRYADRSGQFYYGFRM
ncbi:MAG TPA: trypsin-like peptidase domain-containing protein, partial [Chitinophagales bacterium]|nr:trypsin-like peptidase domain-containing protein [Chitinophagales bacterium]